MKKSVILIPIGFMCLTIVLPGCGASSSSVGGASLPAVTPHVKAAIPTSLGGGTSSIMDIFKWFKIPSAMAALAGSDIKSRFFSATGPTEVLGFILPTLDSQLTIRSLEQSRLNIMFRLG